MENEKKAKLVGELKERTENLLAEVIATSKKLNLGATAEKANAQEAKNDE
ncbi:MAG: hypothetical protein PHF67_04890 [Candidatus Nanoarchaeia archaeon]|nr:hypothetical protein [Candidatus Nanoarchaeia archaeon]